MRAKVNCCLIYNNDESLCSLNIFSGVRNECDDLNVNEDVCVNDPNKTINEDINTTSTIISFRFFVFIFYLKKKKNKL